jgi:hypothetical protein
MREAKTMKRLFTLILSSLFALTSFAQYGQTVTVSFAAGGKGNGYGNKTPEVVIDGRSYYSNNDYNSTNGNGRDGSWDKNDNSITLNNLQVGQHSILINSGRNNDGKYGNVNVDNRPTYSSTFTVKRGYDLNIFIKGNGEVSYSEKPVYNNGRRSDDRDWRGSRDYERRRDDDDRRNDNGGYDSRRNDNGGHGNRRNDNAEYNRYPNNNMPAMYDAQFNELLQNVRGKWFQSGKISAVRSAFDNTSNYFSTYQVRQLLQLISSESSRLDLAKTSYKNIVDKNSFTQLYDLFSKQSNRDDLDRYVRGYRY